jgi:hypothetical protein
MPRETDREVWNRLRVDLYRRLLPRIREEDQRSGALGYVTHFDDPDAFWDSGDPSKAWDAIGLSPVIQELFYVLETMEGEDIQALESLDALVDPLRCPEKYLPALAASFGYALEERLPDEQKRAILLGLIKAFKARGTFAGFKIFYRMIGFEVIDVRPLFKKTVNEASNDYSSVRYATQAVTQPIGPMGVSQFAGMLADAPFKPGTLRFSAGGGVVIRDDPETGALIGPTTESGSVNPKTGEFTLILAAPAATAVTAAYDKITEEWPYHAARIDLEISISPGGLVDPPLVDGESVEGILGRLDEVRPVHVLLRVLALIVEMADNFAPGATDKFGCRSMMIDARDGLPFPATPGRYFQSMADQGVAGMDDLLIQHWNGADVVLEGHQDDRVAIVCPLDVLKIQTYDGGGNPIATTYA